MKKLKRTAEQVCLLSDIQLKDANFNILDFKTREMIHNLNNLSPKPKFDVYELTVRGYELGQESTGEKI